MTCRIHDGQIPDPEVGLLLRIAAIRAEVSAVKRSSARSFFFVSSILLFSPLARAADLDVPAQGGLPGLSVSLARDGKSLKVVSAGRAVDVPIDPPLKPGAKAELHSVAIGQGRAIAHVIVPTQDGPWEALLAPSSDAPLFAGRTGFVRGPEGEREGTRVEIARRADGTSSVLVSEIREDSRICGEDATSIRPRGLEPKSLTLRGATVQRLSAEARTKAKKLIAESPPSPRLPPVAKVLSLGGESSVQGLAKNLLDDRADTAWTEDRPGVGQGEFVTFRSSRDLPIARIVLTVTPTSAPADFAPPHSLYLVTPGETRELVVPDDAAWKVGGEIEFRFAVPLRTECLSLVLGDAFAEGVTSPRVGLAGIAAYAALEAKPLDAIARDLGAGGESAEAATAFLKRAGEAGLTAIANVYGALDGAGRARAIDVATSAPSCDAASRVLLVGVIDTDREASRKARDRIERCGKGAARALITGLSATDPKLRAVSAELLGLVAPREGLEPLVGALGGGDRIERSAVRAATAKAAKNAPPATLDAWLSQGAGPKRLEILRAFSARLAELPHAEEALVSAARASEMGTRYVLVDAARALALARPDRPGPLLGLLDDTDGSVRAHAAEASAGIVAAKPKLVVRLSDPEPRVREAALMALASSGAAPPLETTSCLAHDEWTFVRVAAASALGSTLAVSPTIDKALEAALFDSAVLVKQASLSALGARHATGSAGAISAVAKDSAAPLDLRVTATRTLGAVCAVGELEFLTRAAQRALSPIDEADLRMGVAAIDALGRIHPEDLGARLAKLRDKNVRPPLRHAADRAIEEPSACRATK
jgi:hypothetical protein